MSNKTLTIGVVLAIVIAVLAYFHAPVQKALFGSTDCQSTTCLTGGLRILDGLLESDGTFAIGATGTAITHAGFGACNLIGSDASQPATSTKAYDCAITGITVTDNVIAQLASSTPVKTSATNSGTGWMIVGADASTTAGFATVLLYNGSGAAAVPSVTSVGSSTAVWLFR